MTVEQGQYTHCLNCEESVDINRIDNMDDEVDPSNYCIILTFDKCKCGFVTVLEYQMNIQFSLRASEEASNEAADEQIWYAQENWGYKIGKDEEE